MIKKTFYCPTCDRHKPLSVRSDSQRRGHSLCVQCREQIRAREIEILTEQAEREAERIRYASYSLESGE